jgi:hypothetical protein
MHIQWKGLCQLPWRGTMVGMIRFRPRIGLRLMLLLVALCCVLCAYYRAAIDLRHENMRRRLMNLEGQRAHVEVISKGCYKPPYIAQLKAIDAEIAAMSKAIGDERLKAE